MQRPPRSKDSRRTDPAARYEGVRCLPLPWGGFLEPARTTSCAQVTIKIMWPAVIVNQVGPFSAVSQLEGAGGDWRLARRNAYLRDMFRASWNRTVRGTAAAACGHDQEFQSHPPPAPAKR